MFPRSATGRDWSLTRWHEPGETVKTVVPMSQTGMFLGSRHSCEFEGRAVGVGLKNRCPAKDFQIRAKGQGIG